jgi:hypothetical protein
MSFFCCLLTLFGCTKKDTPKTTRHDYIAKMNGVHIWHGTHSSYSYTITYITDTFEIKVVSDTSIELYLPKKIGGIPRVTCQLVTPMPHEDSIIMFEKIESKYLSYRIRYRFVANSIQFQLVNSNFYSSEGFELTTP